MGRRNPEAEQGGAVAKPALTKLALRRIGVIISPLTSGRGMIGGVCLRKIIWRVPGSGLTGAQWPELGKG